jgi:NAD-dependent deacetylase
LKPGTVLFGEPLPENALDMAALTARNCDIFLVLGSSLVVYPANSLPRIAKKSGAILVIVNIDQTPLDDIADLVINKSTSEVLSKLI